MLMLNFNKTETNIQINGRDEYVTTENNRCNYWKHQAGCIWLTYFGIRIRTLFLKITPTVILMLSEYKGEFHHCFWSNREPIKVRLTEIPGETEKQEY